MVWYHIPLVKSLAKIFFAGYLADWHCGCTSNFINWMENDWIGCTWNFLKWKNGHLRFLNWTVDCNGKMGIWGFCTWRLFMGFHAIYIVSEIPMEDPVIAIWSSMIYTNMLWFFIAKFFFFPEGTLQCGVPKIATVRWFITPITMIYGTYNYS